MRYSTHFKSDISELYISGNSSPSKSPVQKPSPVLKNFRAISLTPDHTRRGPNSLKFSNKWYIRGHKFTTIFNDKKPKTVSKFAPTSEKKNKFLCPVINPVLLLKQKRWKKPKITPFSFSVSIKITPKTASMNRRNSSKNLQISPDELSSWLY